MKRKIISSIIILFGSILLFSCKGEVQQELSETIERVSIDEIEEA